MANSCPWKFVVFKIYRFSSKYASFKNINIDSQCFQFQFQGAAIRPIVPRQNTLLFKWCLSADELSRHVMNLNQKESENI